MAVYVITSAITRSSVGLIVVMEQGGGEANRHVDHSMVGKKRDGT